MSVNLHACPYCRVTMEQGFVGDQTHHARLTVPQWVEGEPESSFWSGLKTKDRRVLSVATWRCPDCGFLASFAK